MALPFTVALAHHHGHGHAGNVLTLARPRISAPAGFDRDLVAGDLERGLVFAEHAAHEQLERCLGAFVLPAECFPLLNVVTDRASLVEGDLDTALVKLADDIADAGEFRDEEAIGVSPTLRPGGLVRLPLRRARRPPVRQQDVRPAPRRRRWVCEYRPRRVLPYRRRVRFPKCGRLLCGRSCRTTQRSRHLPWQRSSGIEPHNPDSPRDRRRNARRRERLFARPPSNAELNRRSWRDSLRASSPGHG